MDFKSETKIFQDQLPSWIAAGFEGRWVAIVGDKATFHETIEAAYQDGTRRAGNVKSVFVKQILKDDSPKIVFRVGAGLHG